ncbi:MAG: hypothetical protein Kow0089_09230 [Desulfobulbaceae bacterium]
MGTWRPVRVLLLLLAVLMVLDLSLFLAALPRQIRFEGNAEVYDVITAGLGLTDLCVATEARYTRHPAVSDPVAPFMDHPGALEHFPTGSFWAPPIAAGGR